MRWRGPAAGGVGTRWLRPRRPSTPPAAGCPTAKPRTALDAISHPAGMLELTVLLLGVIPAALCSRRDLVLENLLLRHQLAVAARPRRRPRLRTRDKLLWLVARRFYSDWRRHVVLVTPDTVVRWHRQ